MYKVIKKFRDLQDDNYIYEVGATYPREGKRAALDRVTELMGSKNKIGEPLIEEIVEDIPFKEVEEAKEPIKDKEVKKRK